MSFRLFISPAAKNELVEGFEWYEEQQEGLGEKLISSVNRHLKRIAVAPEQYQMQARGYRQCKIEMFPYVIVYKFAESEGVVTVIAIFHTSRKPSRKDR